MGKDERSTYDGDVEEDIGKMVEVYPGEAVSGRKRIGAIANDVLEMSDEEFWLLMELLERNEDKKFFELGKWLWGKRRK